jgi:hypothetical protein
MKKAFTSNNYKISNFRSKSNHRNKIKIHEWDYKLNIGKKLKEKVNDRESFSSIISCIMD